MDSRTGFIDVNGSGLDLIYLYEPRTTGPAGTTTYISQTYGQDLGSIFYLNANLGGLGLKGDTGANCGYKNSFGIDLGSLFCAKGTVAPLVIAFTPLSVAGCSIWLDATDISTLFTNANGTGAVTGTTTGVKYWKNKAGSTNNATWSTTTPTDNTAGVSYTVGTYPNLNFAGRGSDINMSLTGISDIFVVSSNNAATYGGYYGMIGGGVAGGSSYFFGMQTLTTVSSSAVSTTILYNGGTNPPASVSNINLFEKVGGVGTTLLTPTLGGGLFGIGRGDQNAIYQWQGTIREVLIYTSPVSTSDRINIEGYLAKKWGLQSLLPSTHPYYNSLVLYYPFNTDVLNYATGTGVSDGSIVSGGVNCLVQSTIKQFGAGSFQNTTGSTSYFSLPTTTANQNGYTFSFWVYLTAVGTSGMIWAFSQSGAINNRIFCYYGGTNITLSIYGTQSTIIPNAVGNTWYHIAWTCTKGSVNNAYGSIAGGTFGGIFNSTITQAYQSAVFNKNVILADPVGTPPGSGAKGYVDEFYYYDGVLNSTQLSNLYTNNDPGVQLGLLAYLPTGCVGLFACKWVNNGYSGPILKLRKGISTTQDFYMDKTGTQIGAAANGTGQTLDAWLSATSDTIAYVDTWYDQSGLGKHATQTLTANQPTLSKDVLNFYMVDCGSSSNITAIFLNLPDGTVPSGSSSYTVSIKHGIFNPTLQPLFLSSGTQYGMNAFYYNDGANLGYVSLWWGLQNVATPKYGYLANNIFTIRYLNTGNMYFYRNSSLVGSLSGLSARSSLTTYNFIGGRYFTSSLANTPSAPLYFISINNTSMTDTDRQTMEGIYLFVLNGNFDQTITTPQAVSSMDYVNNWTVSSTSTFFLATTADTTYTRGSTTTSPYVALPTEITKFLVSRLTTTVSTHNIKQYFNIPSAGIYTLTFYHNGKTGTNPYVTTHTLTVGLASKTVVSSLQTTNSGWQLFTGSVALTAEDVGYKDLTLTFTNSAATNSSFFITGVVLNYVGPAVGTGLLATVPTGSVGLFATKWVNNNYVGPILRLRKSTDTTGASPQDFFMDSTGYQIGTMPNGTGTSLATWLGAAPTAFVDTWYDQSLQFKHAVQSATASQTTYDYTNKYIDFGSAGFFRLPDNTFPVNNNPYSIVYNYSGSGIFTGTIFYNGILANSNTSLALRTNPGMVLWLNSSGASAYGPAGYTPSGGSDVQAYVYSPNSLVLYQKGNATPSTSYTAASYTGGEINMLGFGVTSFAYKFGAQLSFFSIFNTALTGTLADTSSDLGKMGNIGTLIVTNGSFSRSSIGQATTTTSVNNWTVSTPDLTNIFFALARTNDATYTQGSSIVSPYVALPSSITGLTGASQFLVSRLKTSTAAVSHSIIQSVIIPAAGIYTLTFYHAGRTGTDTYSTNHTLAVDIGTQNVVSALQTTTSATASSVGWQLFTGSVAITSAGTKDLKFTFTNSNITTTDSSYYITGVVLNYIAASYTGDMIPQPITTPTTEIYTISNQTGTLVFKNGRYISSSSSRYASFFSYNAFDNLTGNFWHSQGNGVAGGYPNSSDGNQYTQIAYDTNGNYIGGGKTTNYWKTTISGTDYGGEWLQIELPFSFVLTSHTYIQRTGYTWTQAPKLFYVAGSSDGITWFLLHQYDYTSIAVPTGTGASVTYAVSNNSNYYRFYRFVYNKIFGGEVHPAEWKLGGYM